MYQYRTLVLLRSRYLGTQGIPGADETSKCILNHRCIRSTETKWNSNDRCATEGREPFWQIGEEGGHQGMKPQSVQSALNSPLHCNVHAHAQHFCVPESPLLQSSLALNDVFQ